MASDRSPRRGEDEGEQEPRSHKHKSKKKSKKEHKEHKHRRRSESEGGAAAERQRSARHSGSDLEDGEIPEVPLAAGHDGEAAGPPAPAVNGQPQASQEPAAPDPPTEPAAGADVRHRLSEPHSPGQPGHEAGGAATDGGRAPSPAPPARADPRSPERMRGSRQRSPAGERSRPRSRDRHDSRARRSRSRDRYDSRQRSRSRDHRRPLEEPPRPYSRGRDARGDAYFERPPARRDGYGGPRGAYAPREEWPPPPRRRSRSRSLSRDSKRRRGEGDWEARQRRHSGRDERGSGDGGRRRGERSPGGPGGEEEPELDVDALMGGAVDEEEEERRRLEESRRRRQAILAKHQQAAAAAAPTATELAAGGGAAALGASAPPSPAAAARGVASAPAAAGASAPPSPAPVGAEATATAGESVPPSPAAARDAAAGDETPEGERDSDGDSGNVCAEPALDIWTRERGGGGGADEAVSRRSASPGGTATAPGTEPNLQSERLKGTALATGVAGDAAATDAAAAAPPAADAAAGDDMFAEDVADDMFAEGGGVGAGAMPRAAGARALADAYDDAEGYYNYTVGEVMDGRYEVFACMGKGVFSTVLRARDRLRALPPHEAPAAAGGAAAAPQHPEVAIKMIRSNETMSKAAALEQRILRALADADPDNRKHCIRMLRSFEYRHHVCMVFESMDLNLRELTNKYGRGVGLNIGAVGIYACQLLIALRHLKKCKVLHADIKPDNILVNARRTKVKLCDFGSAMLAGQNERTPYLVSRFYRAPEVILGLAYDFPMDMWSVGCVVYELFTGRILFPGRTNNDMLRCMMDVRGPFPRRMLKRGLFADKHFDGESGAFALMHEDPVTKAPVCRLVPNPQAKHSFAQLLGRGEGDRTKVSQLADLLDQMMALDPERRISPDAALRHPFIAAHLPKRKEGGA